MAEYSQPMTRRDYSNAPAAVLEWQAKEGRWREQAKDWVRSQLALIISSDETYELRTTAQYLAMLDVIDAQPEGFARINKPGTSEYNERYAIVRNALEVMAKHRAVVCGSTINTKGNPRSTTYGRPRDVSGDWMVDSGGKALPADVMQGLQEFLSTRGKGLEHLDGITLVRKTASQSGGIDSGNKGTSKSKRARRKPRTTRGGD